MASLIPSRPPLTSPQWPRSTGLPNTPTLGLPGLIKTHLPSNCLPYTPTAGYWHFHLNSYLTRIQQRNSAWASFINLVQASLITTMTSVNWPASISTPALTNSTHIQNCHTSLLKTEIFGSHLFYHTHVYNNHEFVHYSYYFDLIYCQCQLTQLVINKKKSGIEKGEKKS